MSERLVLCHGTFDLIHPGHLEHLRQARALGDRLVVGVTADAYVNKGPGRPVFSDVQRQEMLLALKLVDEAVIVVGPSALPLIHSVKPQIYAKGPDYANGTDPAGNLAAERAAVESYGGKLVFTTGEKYSSSALINGNGIGRSPEVAAYLADVKQRFDAKAIMGFLDAAKPLMAQVIGEQIADQYVYVSPAGKSAKENTIAYVGEHSQGFGGGAAVVAAHLSQLVEKVDILAAATPIQKIRYVEQAFTQKVFSFVPCPTVPPLSQADIEATAPADLTLVADYGHGLIDRKAALTLSQKCEFLALTVQANSLNWGFNLLNKYKSAHYVVADEMELRLARSDRDGDIRELAKAQCERMGCHMLAVTLGHHGCLVYDGQGFAEAPALAKSVIDRMGAGDAFLAWTAPLAAIGAPKEIVAFVGSVAAGIKVGMIGNQVVTKAAVESWVRSLLA